MKATRVYSRPCWIGATRDEAISRLQQYQADLKRLGVKHLYLFGSMSLEAFENERRPGRAVSDPVNDQFRICFVWTPDGPEAVEITDYH